MRIVPNLTNLTECPNCGNKKLILTKNEFHTPYKQCIVCTEEIYENEMTCDDEEEKEKKKEQFIFDLREDVSYLAQNIHDAHSMTLVCNLRDIFNKIIDYIEEN